MRKLIAGLMLTGCAAGAANAADLPLRSAPMMPYMAPAPLFTWTGFYAGLNAGATFGNGAGRFYPNGFTAANGFPGGGGNFGPFRGSTGGAGFTGGGQIGYNWQSGMFVYGAEADLGYYGQGGGNSRTFASTQAFTAPGSTFTLSGGNGGGFLGTVRGRVGVAVFDRTLLYATGGLAYGDIGQTYGSGRFTNGASPAITADFTSQGTSGTRVGYALGAGAEYAFTPRISGKVEYLYANLGDHTYQLTNPATAAAISARSSGETQLARVGLNYKF